MKERIEKALHTEALHVAIVLAAGKGSRMNSDIPKQYLLLKGKPLVCHCLDTLEASPCIDQVVLVVGRGEVDYVRSQIIEAYSYQKVSAVRTPLPNGQKGRSLYCCRTGKGYDKAGG